MNAVCNSREIGEHDPDNLVFVFKVKVDFLRVNQRVMHAVDSSQLADISIHLLKSI